MDIYDFFVGIVANSALGSSEEKKGHTHPVEPKLQLNAQLQLLQLMIFLQYFFEEAVLRKI